MTDRKAGMSVMRLRFERGPEARAIEFAAFVAAVQQAVAQSGLPVAKGLHKYRIAPGPPLATGHTSRCEYMDFELEDAITGVAFLKALSPSLPPGVRAAWARRMPAGAPHPRAAATGYEYTVGAPLDAAKAEAFHASRTWPFVRDRANRSQQFDLKRSVSRLTIGPAGILIGIRVLPEGTPKPQEAIASIFGLSMDLANALPMERTAVHMAPMPRFASQE